MPPLDDELRAALHGRAATLTPPVDPLAGVERRARSIRRRRVAASVAGSALAVLAVAGAVPALAPDRTAAPTPGEVATSGPSPSADPLALDPSEPWTYRGISLGTDFVDTLAREVALRHPGTGDEGRVIALFGQRYEPSAQLEAVFVAQLTDGTATWGVAQTSESGLEVVHEQDLAPRTRALVVALPGDEASRLLVVAAPQVQDVQYADAGGDLGAEYGLAALAQGVATGPLAPPDPDTSVVGVVDNARAFSAPVPRPAVAPDGPPANVLDWPTRGRAVDPQVLQQARDFLAANRDGADPADVESKVLFSGEDDAGRRYLLGQFWLPGEDAAVTVVVVRTAQGGERDELQLLQPLAADADVAALQLPAPNGQSVGDLVVVPRPGTGQVLYAGDEAGEWQPKDTPGLDGVVLLERNPAAERGQAVDRVRLLDGDGAEIGTFPVADLLCGTTSCS